MVDGARLHARPSHLSAYVADMTDDPEAPFDGPCAVCGETCKGQPYVALGLFCVGGGDATNEVMFFHPDDEPDSYEDWNDLDLDHAVHLACSSIYFEGVLADLRRHQREANGG